MVINNSLALSCQKLAFYQNCWLFKVVTINLTGKNRVIFYGIIFANFLLFIKTKRKE